MLDIYEEQEFFAAGYKFVGGIDEAGRGPLAGPVVAACVVLRADFPVDDPNIEMIKDSKQLTERSREEAIKIIYAMPMEVGIGICDHAAIDRINILQASFLAMKKALSSLKQKPEYILLDGNLPIPNLSIPQKTIISGDKTVFAIAAASIVAKVTRDRIMRAEHKKYPAYGFDKHKGYGTKMHLQRLETIGPCPIHRLSFAPVKRLL
jgi:ribonuclease HII